VFIGAQLADPDQQSVGRSKLTESIAARVAGKVYRR
jgi:hypothetical protein